MRCRRQTRARQTICLAGSFSLEISNLRFEISVNNPGGFLLSHAVARAVPSAPRGLTSVFGMGTGVTLSTQPPENRFDFGLRISNCEIQTGNQVLRKNSFGSGDLAVRACKRFMARTAKTGPKSALRNLLNEISDRKFEI